jgi:ADP-ribosylation factor-like protein 2
LLTEERLAGASLLVFCNKQDLPNALSQESIRDTLQLEEITTHHWSIHKCSAKSGEPEQILKGINWLVTDVNSRLYYVD